MNRIRINNSKVTTIFVGILLTIFLAAVAYCIYIEVSTTEQNLSMTVVDKYTDWPSGKSVRYYLKVRSTDDENNKIVYEVKVSNSQYNSIEKGNTCNVGLKEKGSSYSIRLE